MDSKFVVISYDNSFPTSEASAITMKPDDFIYYLNKFQMVPEHVTTSTATQVDSKTAEEMNFTQSYGTQCEIRMKDCGVQNEVQVKNCGTQNEVQIKNTGTQSQILSKNCHTQTKPLQEKRVNSMSTQTAVTDQLSHKPFDSRHGMDQVKKFPAPVSIIDENPGTINYCNLKSIHTTTQSNNNSQEKSKTIKSCMKVYDYFQDHQKKRKVDDFISDIKKRKTLPIDDKKKKTSEVKKHESTSSKRQEQRPKRPLSSVVVSKDRPRSRMNSKENSSPRYTTSLRQLNEKIDYSDLYRKRLHDDRENTRKRKIVKPSSSYKSTKNISISEKDKPKVENLSNKTRKVKISPPENNSKVVVMRNVTGQVKQFGFDPKVKITKASCNPIDKHVANKSDTLSLKPKGNSNSNFSNLNTSLRITGENIVSVNPTSLTNSSILIPLVNSPNPPANLKQDITPTLNDSLIEKLNYNLTNDKKLCQPPLDATEVLKELDDDKNISVEKNNIQKVHNKDVFETKVNLDIEVQVPDNTVNGKVDDSNNEGKSQEYRDKLNDQKSLPTSEVENGGCKNLSIDFVLGIPELTKEKSTTEENCEIKADNLLNQSVSVKKENTILNCNSPVKTTFDKIHINKEASINKDKGDKNMNETPNEFQEIISVKDTLDLPSKSDSVKCENSNPLNPEEKIELQNIFKSVNILNLQKKFDLNAEKLKFIDEILDEDFVKTSASPEFEKENEEILEAKFSPQEDGNEEKKVILQKKEEPTIENEIEEGEIKEDEEKFQELNDSGRKSKSPSSERPKKVAKIPETNKKSLNNKNVKCNYKKSNNHRHSKRTNTTNFRNRNNPNFRITYEPPPNLPYFFNRYDMPSMPHRRMAIHQQYNLSHTRYNNFEPDWYNRRF